MGFPAGDDDEVAFYSSKAERRTGRLEHRDAVARSYGNRFARLHQDFTRFPRRAGNS
jgi:hypothetical protein